MELLLQLKDSSTPQNPKKPATFFYRIKQSGLEPISIIELRQIKCQCGKFIFTPDDYMYLLEHEITEIITKEVGREDGIRFSAEGFNNAFSPIRAKYKKHECCFLKFQCRYG